MFHINQSASPLRELVFLLSVVMKGSGYPTHTCITDLLLSHTQPYFSSFTLHSSFICIRGPCVAWGHLFPSHPITSCFLKDRIKISLQGGLGIITAAIFLSGEMAGSGVLALPAAFIGTGGDFQNDEKA